MALPFALDVYTGRYPFFLFFLLSTTLPYSSLHHVQLATAALGLFDVYDHFAVAAVLFASTMVLHSFVRDAPQAS